jgi:hypothetical protein
MRSAPIRSRAGQPVVHAVDAWAAGLVQPASDPCLRIVLPQLLLQ